MNEEIKDAAITLLQTLINATGAEPEDERLAIQIIAKTMQEVVNENNLLQRVSNCKADCKLSKLEQQLDALQKVHGNIINEYNTHTATQAFKYEDGAVYRVRLDKATGQATLD